MSPTDNNTPALYSPRQESAAVATTNAQAPVMFVSKGTIFESIDRLENAYRFANALAASNLIPVKFQKKPEDCLIALDLANIVGVPPLMVMQNISIVEGNPSWAGKFVMAAIQGCRRFVEVQYEMGVDGPELTATINTYTGTKEVKTPNTTCRVTALRADNGKPVHGPTVSIAMAISEGWFTKKGSKWQTMPELMLRYRAASYFGKVEISDVLMGMQSEDELVDIAAQGAADLGTGAEVLPGVEIAGGSNTRRQRAGRPAPLVIVSDPLPTNEEDPERMAMPFGPGAIASPVADATPPQATEPAPAAVVPAQPAPVASTAPAKATGGFQMTAAHLDALTKLALNPLASALAPEERTLCREFAVAYPEYLPLPQRIGSKTELHFTQAGNEYLGEVAAAMGTPAQVAQAQVIEMEPAGAAILDAEFTDEGTPVEPAQAATMHVLKNPQPTPQELRDAKAAEQYDAQPAPATVAPVMLGPDKDGKYHEKGSTGAFSAWPPFGDPETYRQANHPEGEDPLKEIFGHD